MSDCIVIRPAGPADAAALRDMQALSLRVLGAGYYAPAVIDAYIAEVGTLDDHLLRDGRYLVATRGSAIVGCGGWSTQPAAYSGLVSETGAGGGDPATIRALYVHPSATRRGIAGRIMAATEADMAASGYRQAGMLATLSGLSFYRRLGYATGNAVSLGLGDGLAMQVVEMRKALIAGAAAAA
jgi:GNAT superfamily N-acetyltransferase